MQICEHEYNGYKIWYDDFSETWACELGNKATSKEKIGDVRKRIDDHIKKQDNFQRFEAIYVSEYSFGRANFGNVVTVTSFADEKNAWTQSDKGRSKEMLSDLAENTEDNRVILAKVTALFGEKKAIEETIEATIKSFKRVSPRPPHEGR